MLDAMDLTREHRNATIARANERASQTVEEETGGEEEDTDDDGAETGSPNTQLSIAYETNPTLSTLIEDEDPERERNVARRARCGLNASIRKALVFKVATVSSPKAHNRQIQQSTKRWHRHSPRDNSIISEAKPK